MKTTGLTTLVASGALGLSLAAWAAVPICGYVGTTNPNKIGAGKCIYVNGALVGNGDDKNGCTQESTGPGTCTSNSSAPTKCGLGKATFTNTPYFSTGCPSAGTNSAGYMCTPGTPATLNLTYAYDTKVSCVSTEGPSGGGGG